MVRFFCSYSDLRTAIIVADFGKLLEIITAGCCFGGKLVQCKYKANAFGRMVTYYKGCWIGSLCCRIGNLNLFNIGFVEAYSTNCSWLDMAWKNSHSFSEISSFQQTAHSGLAAFHLLEQKLLKHFNVDFTFNLQILIQCALFLQYRLFGVSRLYIKRKEVRY